MSPGKSVHLAGTEAYDPIPDLAQLLSGLRALPGPQYQADLRAVLAGLQFGPVARLTAGLRLTDPAVAVRGAEAAIYAAVQSFITKTGHLLTRADLDKLTAEAERGYDPASLRPRACPECGRPSPEHKLDCTTGRESPGAFIAKVAENRDAAPPPHPELGPLSGHQADGPANCRRCQLIRENAHWLALPENPEG